MKKIAHMFFLLATGFVIVALPDSGERLFSISQDHGPSLLDAVGLVILLTGYAGLVTQAWKRREKVLKYKHSGHLEPAWLYWLPGSSWCLLLCSMIMATGGFSGRQYSC